ncbi:MAG: hypothetical protein AB7O67_02485 [Vicinamibacterales bacterium]
METPLNETSPSRAPLGQLERSLIDDYLRKRGYDRARLDRLPVAERERVLRAASVHASGRLSEVESRAHLADDMRNHPTRDPGGHH